MISSEWNDRRHFACKYADIKENEEMNEGEKTQFWKSPLKLKSEVILNLMSGRGRETGMLGWFLNLKRYTKPGKKIDFHT